MGVMQWGPNSHHSYVVLDTQQGHQIVTERLEDGTVTWEENPADLEDRNSIAKFIRSSDVNQNSTVGDMKHYQVEQAHIHTSSKGYVQGAFVQVCGLDMDSATSGFRHHPPPTWRLSELEQETTHFAPWTYDDTLEERKAKKEAENKARKEAERKAKLESEMRERVETEF